MTELEGFEILYTTGILCLVVMLWRIEDAIKELKEKTK